MRKRIAIAVENCSQNEETVADHFARCSKFVVYEVMNNKIHCKETYFNPFKDQHGGTCQLPGFISQYNVDTIIAGGMGSKAVALFQSYDMEVVTSPGTEVQETLTSYLDGFISGYKECTSHHDECH